MRPFVFPLILGLLWIILGWVMLALLASGLMILSGLAVLWVAAFTAPWFGSMSDAAGCYAGVICMVCSIQAVRACYGYVVAAFTDEAARRRTPARPSSRPTSDLAPSNNPTLPDGRPNPAYGLPQGPLSQRNASRG